MLADEFKIELGFYVFEIRIHVDTTLSCDSTLANIDRILSGKPLLNVSKILTYILGVLVSVCPK